MPKIQKQETTIKRISFTQDELKKVQAEVNGIFTKESRTQWLVSKRAIKIIKLKDPKTGNEFVDERILVYPDGSIPFTELSELWAQTIAWVYRAEFANQKQMEFYETIKESIPDKSVQTLNF
jgi:hypothetical protein